MKAKGFSDTVHVSAGSTGFNSLLARRFISLYISSSVFQLPRSEHGNPSNERKNGLVLAFGPYRNPIAGNTFVSALEYLILMDSPHRIGSRSMDMIMWILSSFRHPSSHRSVV